MSEYSSSGATIQKIISSIVQSLGYLLKSVSFSSWDISATILTFIITSIKVFLAGREGVGPLAISFGD